MHIVSEAGSMSIPPFLGSRTSPFAIPGGFPSPHFFGGGEAGEWQGRLVALCVWHTGTFCASFSNGSSAPFSEGTNGRIAFASPLSPSSRVARTSDRIVRCWLRLLGRAFRIRGFATTNAFGWNGRHQMRHRRRRGPSCEGKPTTSRIGCAVPSASRRRREATVDEGTIHDLFVATPSLFSSEDTKGVDSRRVPRRSRRVRLASRVDVRIHRQFPRDPSIRNPIPR